ncbi:polyprenyl synthetase family protein [Deinococcus peraridilitoris]|uniref:Geranylgeranyl pyrophosphate synthase n=1 Tax=Deinococcus peraridilitoris (strain DSM 19664 / LMG 22246 / CIP 109416 / KR-200) TaxID=937777 RepID=L0A4D2_DEIPD|nr:polyprenyl synthetase family protein [Deinococcus peraridilitoris]AFZ68696.1 geranylgeranyl pyrophosphate synthase [Deinococcus peraridilitoris DSM 19664]
MRPEVIERIEALLPAQHHRPEIELLYRMMRDYPARGGKGIRSELLLRGAAAYGAPPGASAWLATAIELFQSWVLIHDDIEDDSEERRGQPALHRQHGVALAINAGDALHAYMWEAVLHAGVEGAPGEFARMIHRTAEGQHVDLAWVQHHQWQLTPSDYLEMVRLKTGYYTVVVPLRLAMMAAGRAPDPRLEAPGLDLGAAFQIRDDVLNLVAQGQGYGKEIGGDLLEGKRTLIVLHWLQGASCGEREAFLSEMAKPRSAKDAEVVAALLHSIQHSGAVEHAMTVAHDLAERGLNALSGVLQEAPHPAEARHILGLMRQLATREA